MKPASLLLLCAIAATAADLRLGIIGTDTSHVTAFAKVLNDPASPDHIPGAKIVAAFKGGSPDIESSAKRVEGFAKELAEKYKVEIVPAIADLCGKVDAILLESVDGRKHLEQAKEAFKCGKPVFIDKPLAATYPDAVAIAKAAKTANVKWFSSSSLRWAEPIPAMKSPAIKSVNISGPGPIDKSHYLDLSWYAIHPIEMLYAIMGPGCEEVTRISSGNDVVVGKWKNGGVGTVHVLRPYGEFGVTAYTEKKIVESGKIKSSYVPMLKEIVKFFQTGVSPVDEEETLEIFAFMDAAQKSKELGGRPVKVKR
ncbi:MAG: Gfo/Idh/MocA family protein [Bryobacteraceae bacterium]